MPGAPTPSCRSGNSTMRGQHTSTRLAARPILTAHTPCRTATWNLQQFSKLVTDQRSTLSNHGLSVSWRNPSIHTRRHHTPETRPRSWTIFNGPLLTNDNSSTKSAVQTRPELPHTRGCLLEQPWRSVTDPANHNRAPWLSSHPPHPWALHCPTRLWGAI